MNILYDKTSYSQYSYFYTVLKRINKNFPLKYFFYKTFFHCVFLLCAIFKAIIHYFILICTKVLEEQFLLFILCDRSLWQSTFRIGVFFCRENSYLVKVAYIC